MARIRKKRIWLPALVGIGLAALLHGLFDFLTLSPLPRIFSALLILAIWLWFISTFTRLAKK